MSNDHIPGRRSRTINPERRLSLSRTVGAIGSTTGAAVGLAAAIVLGVPASEAVGTAAALGAIVGGGIGVATGLVYSLSSSEPEADVEA